MTAVLLVIGSPSLDAQDPPCPLAVVPARVSGLELIGWQKYARPEFGAVFSYRAAGSFGAEVYLYPADESLDVQINAYKANLQAVRERGEFESFEVANERELAGVPAQPAGRHVVVLLRRGNQTNRSHFLVFPIGPQHLKIRVTYPDGRYTDEAVQAFITELLATLPKPAAAGATG